MNYREKAARAASRGNLFFFAAVMLALLSGAFAVTAKNQLTLIISLSLCGVLLVVGCVTVYLHSRIASRYACLAKEEEEKSAAPVEDFAEDGLPSDFCREIRGYSVAQLRLILSEQKEEYTAEEFAFIQKVLSEKE